MRVEQIRSFVHIYETGSFTAAARQLYTEQPVVTKHLAQLENELGCRLFTRTTRKVTPTQAGDVFYKRAREALQLIDQGIAEVKMLGDKARSELRIGYNYLYMDHVTTTWPKEFADSRPFELSTSLSETSRDKLVQQITNGDIDGAFVGVTDENLIPKFMGRMLILSMGEVIVMGKSHQYAKRKSISINDLIGADFVYPTQTPTAEISIVMKDFEALGKQPHTQTTQFESSAMRIVEMGHAVIDLPAESPVDSDNVVKVPYDSQNSILYYFIWNSGSADQTLSDFLGFLRQKTASLQVENWRRIVRQDNASRQA